MLEGFFVAGEMSGIIAVELGENAVKIGAATRRGMIDEIEIGGFEKNDGILMFFGQTTSFLVGNEEGFLFTIVGGGYLGAGLIRERNTVKIGVVFFDFRVGGAKRFAPREDVKSLENRGLTKAVGAKNKRGFRITIQLVSSVIAKID